MTVIEEIRAASASLISEEGWSPEHDDEFRHGEMKLAAMAYVQIASAKDYATDLPAPRYWPWDARSWKPKNKRRDLIRAAALIVAEIERMDRCDRASEGVQRHD